MPEICQPNIDKSETRRKSNTLKGARFMKTAKINGKNSRLGIFVFFDKDGIVDEYVLYLLNDMIENLSKLIIIVNGKIEKSGRKKLEAITEDIYIRENIGFDVAAWKIGLTKYVGWDTASLYDEIVLFNDTVFGPVRRFYEMFCEMKNHSVDFWGITCYWKKPRTWANSPRGDQPTHIQSYFLVIRHNMHASKEFKDYWDKQPIYTSYAEVVGKHELVFTEYFSGCGFSWEVFADTSDRKASEDVMNYNVSLTEPFQLLSKKKCPLLKIKTFVRPLYDSLRYDRSDELYKSLKYIDEETNYPIDLVWQHVLRKYPISDIFYSVGLEYVLSTESQSKSVSNKLLEKTLIIFHIYYIDQIDIIYTYVQKIPLGISIMITTDTLEKKKRLNQKLSDLKQYNKIDIQIISNRGRDVSALLVGARDKIREYEFVCFVHDKKSASAIYTTGRDWQELLWDSLLKNTIYIMNVLSLFADNPRLGLLIPPMPFCGDLTSAIGNRWGRNFKEIASLRHQMNLNVPVSEASEGIIAQGNCFWCRRIALKRLWERKWSYEDFHQEPMPYDGTISHAIERILPMIAQEAGYYTAQIMCPRDSVLEGRNARYMLERLMEKLRFDLKKFPGIYIRNFDVRKIFSNEDNNDNNEIFFPYHLMSDGERIILYGTGEICKRFCQQARRDNIVKIVSIIDKSTQKNTMEGIKVESVDSIKHHEFDSILISEQDPNIAKNIKKELNNLGVSSERIKWDGLMYRRNSLLDFYRKVLSLYKGDFV